MARTQTEEETEALIELQRSAAQHERFSASEIANAIQMSSAVPIFVADGTAIELGAKIRALGSKKISVVVLA